MGLLSNGGLVVVIGARESNAPQFWDHPNVRFLEGAEAVRRGLPVNARGILFTRFLEHHVYYKLVAEAKKRQITVYPMQNTGELKRKLAEILGTLPRPAIVHPESEPLKVSTPVPVSPIISVSTVYNQTPMTEQNATPTTTRLMTLQQAARFLGCSKSAVRTWMNQGKLHAKGKERLPDSKGIRMFSQYVFDPLDVEAFRQSYPIVNKPKRSHKNGTTKKAKTKPKWTFKKTVERIAAEKPKRTAGVAVSKNVLVELVDQAIAALELVREEALKTGDLKAAMRKQFEGLIGTL